MSELGGLAIIHKRAHLGKRCEAEKDAACKQHLAIDYALRRAEETYHRKNNRCGKRDDEHHLVKF